MEANFKKIKLLIYFAFHFLFVDRSFVHFVYWEERRDRRKKKHKIAFFGEHFNIKSILQMRPQ